MADVGSPVSRRRFLVGCLFIGLAAGLLSGLFGVGGGVMIVPLLVLTLGLDQRRAAGTSLAAIVPVATVGVISYAVSGNVAWIPAAILAACAVVGAQAGSWLLPKISLTILRWLFVAFLVAVTVSLFVVIPSREAEFHLAWLSGAGLAVLGFITGVLSALLGVGGGIIVVPALMLLFETSDLVAKGTSLLMMIPAAISGTIGNLRSGNVDLIGAAVIGGSACLTTVVGVMLAGIVDPLVGNLLFAAFLLVVTVQLLVRAMRQRNR